MLNEIPPNQALLTASPMESRWLAVANLPRTATEDTIKEYFERYGRIQSVRIDQQRFAFIGFLNRHSASKAHRAVNTLDDQQLRTTFHDGSTIVPKALLETPSTVSAITELSPPSITSLNKAIITSDDEREKRTPRPTDSPEDNARHQVVPIKRELDLPRSKRKTSPMTHAKSTITASSSSSESERGHRHALVSKRDSHSRTRTLKIYPLPSKLFRQTLREKLRKIFTDFKKPSHLLTIKIIDDYALLTFQEASDVDKALAYVKTKSINGVRLKAEPYENVFTEDDRVKLSIGADMDEYAAKATRTLYMGNLSPEVSHHELRQLCFEYGEIVEIEIKRQQPQASHSQIFAFIQYTDIKSVVRAMKALKTKIIRDRSVKFGFGKNQPTNVLWLDELPSSITELDLRAFLTRLTNTSAEKLLDIYIDHRTGLKNPTAQSLVYFNDVIAAQNAIDLIRGKRLDSQRIQVDFASKVFVAKFSDLIQQTNEKKSSEPCINRSHQCDRRYSKVSDAESTLTISNRTISSHHQSSHHSPASSEHSSHHPKKPVKSESVKDISTERIFDWLMQSDHTNVVRPDAEPLVEKQCQSHVLPGSDKGSTNSTKSHHPARRTFQTTIIPLEADPSFAHCDIRLRVYASMNDPPIKTIDLPFPRFAQTPANSPDASMILNPRAHSKHLSAAWNTPLTVPALINAKNENADTSLHKELDERIRLLDEQIYEINRNNSLLLSSAVALEKHSQKRPSTDMVIHTQQTSAGTSSQTADQSFVTNTRSSTATRHLPTPPCLISPPSSIPNQSSPPSSTDKFIRTTSSAALNLCNHSSTKLLERLGPSAKIKQKPIPPPLSIITTLPILSNTSYSPMFPTPKSITPSSAISEVHYSPQPPALKSILKQTSTLSSTVSQEPRKAVQIISTSPSVDDKNKIGLPKNDSMSIKDTDKAHTEEKKLSNRPITLVKSNHKPSLEKIPKKSMTKLPETTVKIPMAVNRSTQLSSNVKPSPATVKHLDPKTPINRPNTIKSIDTSSKIRSKPFSAVPSKNTSVLNNKNFKLATPLTGKQSVTTTKASLANKSSISLLKVKPNSIPNSTKKSLLNRSKLKSATCMYDRIKNRTRNDQIQQSLLSTKIVHSSDRNAHGDTQSSQPPRLKRSNLMLHSSDSEDDQPLAKTKVKQEVLVDRGICDTVKNDHQRTNVSKLDHEEIVAQKTWTKPAAEKRSSIDKINGFSKKMKKLPPTDNLSVHQDRSKIAEGSLDNTLIEPSKTIDIEIPFDYHRQDTPATGNSTSLRDRAETLQSLSPTRHVAERDASAQLLTSERLPSPVPSPKADADENLPGTILESAPAMPEQQVLPTSRNHISEESVNITSQFLIDNIEPSRSSPEQQAFTVDTKAFCFPSLSIKNEATNYFESHPIASPKHPPTPVHLFPPILTPNNHPFPSPHQQHFPYPLFIPPPSDSPPLSARTLSTSSCSSILDASYYNTMLAGQQYCYGRESRRQSIAESFSTLSDRSTPRRPFYFRTDSVASFQTPAELFDHLGNTQQIYNSLYPFTDVHSFDAHHIQWEGHIVLKTDQAFIKTQLIVGNPQIARLSINYWNCDLHQHLRISQRMRLEKIQLDGVQQHMQIDNDYCILIAEANGFTPDEIRCEQNRLKSGVIQYLSEKQAAGIINISLPGVVQPVYVVHIFPPCEFASEVLQKRAPDAYRCVVQNRLEQIYLLFVITTTV